MQLISSAHKWLRYDIFSIVWALSEIGWKIEKRHTVNIHCHINRVSSGDEVWVEKLNVLCCKSWDKLDYRKNRIQMLVNQLSSQPKAHCEWARGSVGSLTGFESDIFETLAE